VRHRALIDINEGDQALVRKIRNLYTLYNMSYKLLFSTIYVRSEPNLKHTTKAEITYASDSLKG